MYSVSSANLKTGHRGSCFMIQVFLLGGYIPDSVMYTLYAGQMINFRLVMQIFSCSGRVDP